MHYDNELPQIFKNDQIRLKQVLLNLLSNAVKFTNQGKITVSVKQADFINGAWIEVSDTGIGISEEV